MSESSLHVISTRIVCLSCVLLTGATALASSRDAADKPAPVMVDQAALDEAMEKLQARRREREAAAAPATQPAKPDDDPSDPYSIGAVTLRKLEILRTYDARIASARVALRQRIIDAPEVRRLSNERAAFQSLALDRCRTLMIEVDRQNAQRLERYQEAFGDLPAAARTVSVALMKSGQIDFATPLPEDPLTREVEESRGVRRVYFFLPQPTNVRRAGTTATSSSSSTGKRGGPTWCIKGRDEAPVRRRGVVRCASTSRVRRQAVRVAQAPPVIPESLRCRAAVNLRIPVVTDPMRDRPPISSAKSPSSAVHDPRGLVLWQQGKTIVRCTARSSRTCRRFQQKRGAGGCGRLHDAARLHARRKTAAIGNTDSSGRRSSGHGARARRRRPTKIGPQRSAGLLGCKPTRHAHGGYAEPTSRS